MQVAEIVALIEEERKQAPAVPWPGYSFQEIPFAIYDDNTVEYIGHPNPPEERPPNLMAATSIDINGTETATIPVAFCDDEQKALLMAYHEGFHVYQHHHFAPLLPDMFTAMAYYPDLDLEYRTLCALEGAVLRRDDWSTEQKLGALGLLTRSRREILEQHPSLLPYERFLERNEGTASYVEQRTRQARYGIAPTLPVIGHGWQRFYIVGAAFCWLLDSVSDDWTTRIEAGDTPGDLVMEWEDSSVSLKALGYTAAIQREADALYTFEQSIASTLEDLEQPELIRVRYKAEPQVYRAFEPAHLVSMGDGRVLHRTNFTLLLPSRGTIRVNSAACMDHVAAGELILPLRSAELEGNTLRATSDSVMIELMGVEQVDEKLYALR